MQRLAVWADQGQFTKWRLMLHVADLLPFQGRRAGAGNVKRFFGGTCAQCVICCFERAQLLQCLYGRIDDIELASLIGGQSLCGLYPHGFKLLRLISHWSLIAGHPRNQKRDVKAFTDVPVGDPAREAQHVVGAQRESSGFTLGIKVPVSIK